MARQINSFVVDANGGLYKCYNDVGNSSRLIGNLNNKGINTELLTSYLMDADIYDDLECKNCSVLPICGGGCPYLRIKHKKEKASSREFCDLIKGFETDFILSHINRKEKKV